jgi:hypothetical protein
MKKYLLTIHSVTIKGRTWNYFNLVHDFLISILQARTVAEAKAKVSPQNVQSNLCLTFADVLEALDILRGAITIVYPMGLPEYDPIRMELENREDLSGTQAQKEVVDLGQATLWFSSKELIRGKKLKDFLGGANEKSKVILKLSTR